MGEQPYRSATELVDAMAGGEVSAVELAEEAIARIERYDATLNAVCVRDFDRAIDAARAADAARARGDARPLLGVPMTVKESFHVAGLPTTWGIPEFKDFVADEDAVAVERVEAAGAVVLGKTNVPLVLGDVQSYNAIYGTTGNPWDPGLTPGGSSGGSSAALAAGYGALSIGSDIGGSLRNPAHYCGVYAHKPTLGLLPLRGHTAPGMPVLPAESDLAVIGPMARTASDLALLLDVLAGPDPLGSGIAYRLALPAPRHTELADYRVLVVDTHPLIPTAASVRTAIGNVADALTEAGAKVERDSPLLPDQADTARVYMHLLMSTLGARYPAEIYEHTRAAAAQLDPADESLAAERTRGTVLSHRDWLAADGRRAVLRQRWSELFAEFDVVIYPVMPTPAFPHDHSPMGSRRISIDGADHDYLDQIALAGAATLPGLPATALPIGLSEDGLPIGVQAIGPMYGDRTTIRFAELVEREFGGFTPPPLDS
ncbi:amidase [Pseudonocardia hierapolitana]|uniref:Amidase n=1 Tax=Pseudonocardia hierapolitana TaxID=1128676 RepID=A0A561T349_9PSEU|nr:amidase [Pseudonocardia hierapolitana]TWF81536.1 amidase [Pseudonocardia hierapolitana]